MICTGGNLANNSEAFSETISSSLFLYRFVGIKYGIISNAKIINKIERVVYKKILPVFPIL